METTSFFKLAMIIFNHQCNNFHVQNELRIVCFGAEALHSHEQMGMCSSSVSHFNSEK
jgi:hypothetical protein